jgi:AAA+ superfamily predicted ATPase
MSSEFLDDARALARVWLERHLLLYAARYQRADPTTADLYVDRAEVDAFLAGRLGGGDGRDEALAALDAREARLRDAMHADMARAAEAGRPVPSEDLRAAFDVRDERVMDVVLALWTWELDADFARAATHAWCDFTRKEPDIGFVVELVARDADERDRLLGFFLAAEHPLFRYGVLEAGGGAPDRRSGPLVARPVRLCERAVRFLAGDVRPPVSATGPAGGLIEDGGPTGDVLLPDPVKAAFLDAFGRALTGGASGPRVLLWGPRGTGKRRLAAAAATAAGRRLLVGDGRELLEDPATARERLVGFLREARLNGAVPFLAGIDAPGGGDGPDPRLRALEHASRLHAGPWILSATRRMPELGDVMPGIASIKVPHPSADVQRALWHRLWPAARTAAPGFGIDDIVGRYSLAGGAIADVAVSLASGRGPVTAAEVFPAIRDHLSHRLGSLAVPVARGRTWDDLIVPPRTADLLHELAAYVRHRERIVESWGFGTLAGPAGGATALFFGPPGTGKTLAAGILATELGLEAFQIDLSRIVDKYVGETEKNLARVFDEGSRAQAVLLFDEADALFAKRTGVGSAVDRYANLEVNFLLQRMETYEGVCILTSNFPESIDEAFKRRIRFKVEFPHPNREDRARIWRRLIPPQAPLADDVRFDDLAERYDMTGAHLRNVALRAAALAAEEGTAIGAAHLVRAANRESAEMGRLVRDRE